MTRQARRVMLMSDSPVDVANGGADMWRGRGGAKVVAASRGGLRMQLLECDSTCGCSATTRFMRAMACELFSNTAVCVTVWLTPSINYALMGGAFRKINLCSAQITVWMNPSINYAVMGGAMSPECLPY
ncbi:hypothetical protein O6P43_014156 [Quillaja saponaria]|uniref:Uncharacterized protein n=1 Tax=Quillaja saponaria TaxID=32244 RepID=A0AAD7PQL3_QUISA|nr:hypothetical protein O6P43_014156 [Quillaja saponaria]